MTRRPCSPSIVLKIILSLILASAAMETHGSVAYKFRYYTDRDGLSSNTIQCLYQDNKGYIWVGTLDGLDRFNSHDFTNYRYDYRRPYTIENNSIYSICSESISNSDRMWIGTNNGVYIFNSLDETFTRLPLEIDDVEKNNVIVYSLCRDAGGNIWIGTLGAGLFRYNLKSGKLEHYGMDNYPDVFSTDAVSKVMLDRNNNVWISCGSSIHRYNPETNLFSSFHVVDRFTGMAISRVSTMCQDSFGDIWIASNTSELFKFEISGFNFTSYKSGFDFGRVRAMIEYAPGTIMMGSENGLIGFNVKSRSFDHIDDGSGGGLGSLNDKFIHSIIKDRDGGIWVGTYFGGINYLSPLSSLFSTIEPSPECGRVISRMCEDTDGNVWIGSDDGGLSKYDPVSGSYRKVVFDSAHPSPNIHALLIDGPWLWIGTYGNGLYRMNLRTRETVHFSHDFEHTDNLDVYSLLRDSRGNLWIGTKRSICLFDDASGVVRRMADLGVSHDVVDIKEDFYGNVWFASLGSGLMQYNNTDNITTFSQDNNLGTSDYVSCLLVENNNLWIGTHGNGICRYNISDKSITRDFQNTVYANCAVFQMMVSGNEIWMTTNKGLIRYSFDSPNKNIMRFTAEDTLLANIFNPNSGIKTSTGHIYIGCNNGINSFYPYDFTRHENSTRLNVIFPDIKLFNKSVAVAENSILVNTIDNQRSLDLVGGRLSVSIDFVAVNYAAPDRTIYRYKLDGFDEDWIAYDGGGIQHVSYTNLRPGKYLFLVSAANGSEPYGEEASITLNIRPILLASRPMIVLYIIFAIGLLVLTVRYISNKIKRTHQSQIESITRKNKMDLLEAKVSLFTEVANEIRTPVSLISGPLEELMKRPDMPKNIEGDINIIRKNCDRLLHLVNQILNLRSSETASTAEPEPGVDIKSLLEISVMQVRSVLDKSSIKLELDLPEYDVTADIYSEYFGQIITNVVSNAYKYAESHICISLAKDTGSGDPKFTVKVRDDGAGIGRNDQHKIFNTFYTSPKSRVQNGPGIGLSIVRNLALKMGGSIEVDSVVGQWTEFVLKFPCSAEGAGTTEISEENNAKNFEVQTASSDGKDRPHILLLENNPDFIDFFIRHISDRFLVISARDEKEAMEVLRTKGIAAVVAAMDLPEIDGGRFAAEVRNNEQLDHIPVIVISSDTATDSKIRALKAGADVYLEKPLTINYIETQIEALLENRRHLRLKFSKMPYFITDESGSLESGNIFIERVNMYIMENISNSNLSVEDIAEAIGMGRSSFFSKVKSVTGSTPNEYLRLTRLKSAAELLSANNGLRINEVSYMVGFASTSYFSKCFLAEFGLSPNEFRDKYMNR